MTDSLGKFLSDMRAVHTRLRGLSALAKTKGILEGNLVPCQADMALALNTLERCMAQLEAEYQTKPRKT